MEIKIIPLLINLKLYLQLYEYLIQYPYRIAPKDKSSQISQQDVDDNKWSCPKTIRH
jgi:hypothetical protein